MKTDTGDFMGKLSISKTLLLTTMLVGLVGMVNSSCAGTSYQRIDKVALKDSLGNNNVIVIDVRQGRDWKSSKYKIKGAIRLEPNDPKVSDIPLPKDKTLIFY
jgi:hypothetical protein